MRAGEEGSGSITIVKYAADSDERNTVVKCAADSGERNTVNEEEEEEAPNVRAFLEKKILDFLARREHSEYELLCKLQARGFDHALICEVLADFKQRDWQSDQRFSASYITSRIERRYGPWHITRTLMMRGIEPADAKAWVAQYEVDWMLVLKRFYQKKWGSECQTEAVERAKCQKTLYSRGFTEEQIKQFFNQWD